MNRKERRAAKLKTPRPALRDLVTSLGLAAPWCIGTRWPPRYAHSVEMSLAGREVLRRHQYAAEMVSCVLVIGNSMTTLCVGDSRAGYDLLAKRGDRGKLPPYEQWRSAMLLDGDANGGHVVLKARPDGARAFVDLTFGHVTVATKGAIRVPPAFAGFGEIEWPAAQMGDVWFHYGPGAESAEMRDITVQEWSGLIDDLQTLVDIALGYGNDEQLFAAEMRRQMQQLGR